jgi:hypothetical protein
MERGKKIWAKGEKTKNKVGKKGRRPTTSVIPDDTMTLNPASIARNSFLNPLFQYPAFKLPGYRIHVPDAKLIVQEVNIMAKEPRTRLHTLTH